MGVGRSGLGGHGRAGPFASATHSMAFDSWRNRTVVYEPSPATWEYFAPCSVVGPGSPGGGLAIQCSAVPTIGLPFRVSFPSPLGAGLLLLDRAPGAVADTSPGAALLVPAVVPVSQPGARVPDDGEPGRVVGPATQRPRPVRPPGRQTARLDGLRNPT